MRTMRYPRRLSRNAITRRQALRALGGAAGAAALAPWLASCGDGSVAAASPDLHPEDLDIETVILVMMENRSFDHYFGSLSLVEGRPVDGLVPGLSNPDPNGTPISPFRLDLRCVADPPHSWRRSRSQVNVGANDGFVREYHDSLLDDGFPPERAPDVMGYHDRTQLPLFYALADEFALCDRWFCSVLGPTWPNRMFLHSAQSNGRINNDFPEDLINGFTWPTIWDRLNDAGLDWAGYFSDLSFLLLWGRLRDGRLAGIEQFFDDARSGRLPSVCSVEPTFFGAAANDDHPPHDFERGQAFLSAVINAVAQGPQWSRSLIVVTYDEHGGFYDHVPPPTVEDERAAEGFDQLGVRVPGLVISPWARRGHVSSVVTEHSSVPAFVEWLYGLEPLTVRDANASFFLDTLDIDRIRRADPRPAPPLPVLDLDPDVAPECLEFESAGGLEIAQFADRAGIAAHLDRRAGSADRLRWLHRELIRMGAARARR
jgi:phospholipase C